MRKVILRAGARPGDSLLGAYQELLKYYSPSCLVADSMERAGVMSSSIKLLSGKRCVGVAVTVKLYPGDLVDCLDALSIVQPGDFVVVSAGGETETSVWGGLMSSLCLQKGVVGAVVDGAIRDIDEIRDLGFSIWARAITPRSTHSPYSKRLEPIEVNVPVVCGGVLVNPGDIILGDEIGVTVVPLAEGETVLKKAMELAEKEELTRRRIREGKTLEELLEEFGRL